MAAVSLAKPAADEFEVIRSRIVEIRDQAQPKCPRAASKTLFACLRESQRCPSECPHYHDWIGPQPSAMASCGYHRV